MAYRTPEQPPNKSTVMATQSGPGPAGVLLPTGVGYKDHDPTQYINPAWSIASQNMRNFSTVGPGPQRYFLERNLTRIGPDGQPAYSLGPKCKSEIPEALPGPGAYGPEKFPYPPSARPATHVFGRRTRYRTKSMAPGPKYGLPDIVGNGNLPNCRSYPHFTMRQQHKFGHFMEGLARTPCASQYETADIHLTKRKEPSYTCRPKVYPPRGDHQKPGPGQYRSEDVTMNKRGAPSFSFGVRHSQFATSLFIESPDCEPVARSVKKK